MLRDAFDRVVTMVSALEWNLNHGQRNVRLFEIGKTYRWNGPEPVETRVLTLGATGLARERGSPKASAHLCSPTLKATSTRSDTWLVDSCGMRGAGLAPSSAWGTISQGGDGAAARSIGHAGQMARRAAERFKLRQDAYVAELELDPLCAGYQAARAALRVQASFALPCGGA